MTMSKAHGGHSPVRTRGLWGHSPVRTRGLWALTCTYERPVGMGSVAGPGLAAAVRLASSRLLRRRGAQLQRLGEALLEPAGRQERHLGEGPDGPGPRGLSRLTQWLFYD